MGCLGGKCRVISFKEDTTIRPNLLSGIIRKEKGLEGYSSIICTITEDKDITYECFLTSDGEVFVLSDGLIFKVLKDERI